MIVPDNPFAFPPSMGVRSADYAGDPQGRGKVEQRRSVVEAILGHPAMMLQEESTA
jgi:hypothetical protein